MAHHFFALAVSGLLIAYLGNDRSVLHFRHVSWPQVFTQMLTWQIGFSVIMTDLLCRCSRTGRRIFWAILSAVLSWWLVFALRSIDIQGSEGLFFIFSAVCPFLHVSFRYYTPLRSKDSRVNITVVSDHSSSSTTEGYGHSHRC